MGKGKKMLSLTKQFRRDIGIGNDFMEDNPLPKFGLLIVNKDLNRKQSSFFQPDFLISMILPD